MGLDWKLLTKVVDYYKKCGGTVSDRLSEFMDAKLGAYYDELCEKVGVERVMPLLEFYLTRGIEGRSDLKNMESIFAFLIDLTEMAFSAIPFKGDKKIKSILIEGEKNTMARKYNNDWYLKSIECVVESIEKNAAYLYSIRDKVGEEEKKDVVELIGKYEALRDRIRALKDAPPESHLAIIGEIGKVQSLVKGERRKLLIHDFYSSLRATTQENVFLKAEGNLKTAETYVTAPPKGASAPSDSEIVSARIMSEPHSAIDDIIHIQEYRDQCLQLFRSIDASMKTREASVIKLEEGVQEAEAKGRELSQKRQELKRQAENGLISKMQLEREGVKLKMQLDSAASIYNRKKMYCEALSQKFQLLYVAWESFRADLEIIVENDSEDTKLIEHFTNIVEALRRLANFINGLEDDDKYDFTLYQKLVSDVQEELKCEIAEVNIITGAEEDAKKPLEGEKKTNGTDFIFDDDNDIFATPAEIDKPKTETESTAETVTDPGVLIDDEPTEAPLKKPFGLTDDE